MGGSDWDDPGPCSHCAADDVKVVKTVDRVHFHCEQCRTHQPVEIEPLKADDLNPYAWGSIVCKRCHFVIATMSAETPGRLVFVSQAADRDLGRIRQTLKNLVSISLSSTRLAVSVGMVQSAARELLALMGGNQEAEADE